MSGKIRVAIVGVGNGASSLVQGIEFYRKTGNEEGVPGLMHADLGGYRIDDIDFSSAFDVSVVKVGRSLGEAIGAAPPIRRQQGSRPRRPLHQGHLG